jgi:CRP-like cAMP-binding protein
VNTADLKAVKLLAEFGDEDREALAELLEERPLQPGRRVFSEGEEADSLILLLDGTVRLENGDGQVEGALVAGDALGGLSLVRLGQRAATAICEGACRLATLDRSGYRRLADDYPRTACRLMEALLQCFAADVREAIEDESL